MLSGEVIEEIDLCGLKCPLPALHVRKALVRMDIGTVFHVICTDPMAAIDIPHAVREVGSELIDHGRDRERLWFHIRKA